MNQKDMIIEAMRIAQAIRHGTHLEKIQPKRKFEPKPIYFLEPEPEPDLEPMPVNQMPFTEGSVDINTATLEELMAISGLGLAIANGILAARPWASLEELESNVRGVSWARIKAWGLRCG